MSIDNKMAGRQIAALRNAKKITQSELGERLNVSFQAQPLCRYSVRFCKKSII